MKISRRYISAPVALCTAIFAPVAMAHHSGAPHFDSSKELVIEDAAVVEWRFVNPHSYLYFDVTSSDGEVVHWRCESTAATALRRNGWTEDTLSPGQKITIKGSPARREDNACSLTSITLEDGTEIGRSESLAGARARNESTPKDDGRPARLVNGQPNISGDWLTLSFGRDAKGGEPHPRVQGPPTWGGYELTEAGLALAEAYDVRYDDPSLNCHPINIIEGWNHDENINRVVQADDKITLQYGYVDFVRTIHLDIDQHPAGIAPTVGGHSIGHWEGDVLVVDTVGFEQGLLLHQGGVHHSADMHVVERFHIDSETNELVRNYTLTDPAYFVGTREGVDYMQMSSDPYVPYDCVELGGKNNERPEN